MASFFDKFLKGDARQPAIGPVKAEMPASDEGRAVLQNYLDASARFGKGDSHLLPPLQVLEQSGLFAYHPIIQQLGGYVLDDADTSDHHILATSSPLIGSVLFLAHDGDTRFVFDSGSTFLAAVREAHERGIEVTDLHPDHSPLAKDQSALGAFVRSLLDGQELNDVVVSLIPSLNLEDIDLLRRLAQDEDFFLGEAVGTEIERRPSPALLPIAELCAAHRHPQVARAGERAVRRIRQLG
ncbi:hypothetical protein [Variovorax sp. R-27]|uniref:hypothetical protein n=1 Tax=Variovorax sp. R-27 TaxID=3404058 RepID=UPI003CE926B9